MIIAIINHKGGVGKTTTAVNLSVALAVGGHATLLVDCDPQAHATRCVLQDEPERTVGDLLMDVPSRARRAISETEYENLDIVGATEELTEKAEWLATRIRREERLTKALNAIDDYDYVILDAAPTEGILTHNVISAADLLLIPVQTGGGAIEGVKPLLTLANELHDGEDVPYRLLLTMYDARTSVTNNTIAKRLREHRKYVLGTVIGKSEPLNQANLASKPIVDYAPGSRGAAAYDKLARDIIKLT